jgi:hypothetical protein
MVKAIREAGRTPVQRNTFYEPIRISDAVEQTVSAKAETSSPVLDRNLATA